MPLRWVKKYYFWIVHSRSDVVLFKNFLTFCQVSPNHNSKLQDFCVRLRQNVYHTLSLALRVSRWRVENWVF